MTKKKYEKPKVTEVVLNPAQAVLSVCSTGGTNVKSAGTSNTCKGAQGVCTKKGAGGDSAGQC